MGKATLTTILLAAGLVLLAAGCGGGDGGNEASGAGNPSPSGTQAPPSSRQEFVKEADAVCAKGQKQTEAEFVAFLKKNNIKKFGESGESPSETKALEAEVIETIGIPAFRKQIDELRAIGMPSGGEAKVEAYFDALEEEIEEGEEDPQLLFSSASKVFAKSDKLAQQLGFKVCGGH